MIDWLMFYFGRPSIYTIRKTGILGRKSALALQKWRRILQKNCTQPLKKTYEYASQNSICFLVNADNFLGVNRFNYFLDCLTVGMA